MQHTEGKFDVRAQSYHTFSYFINAEKFTLLQADNGTSNAVIGVSKTDQTPSEKSFLPLHHNAYIEDPPCTTCEHWGKYSCIHLQKARQKGIKRAADGSSYKLHQHSY
jgi:hypothetical protein